VRNPALSVSPQLSVPQAPNSPFETSWHNVLDGQCLAIQCLPHSVTQISEDFA
jgi:hypothetical protein